MQQAIIFDLDDTLINTHKRHYLIFSGFVIRHGGVAPTFEEYTHSRKANTLSNKALLTNILPGHGAAFEQYWIQNIESTEWLAVDTPIIRNDLLNNASNAGIKLLVLSLRSNRKTALQQVQSFAFSSFIDDFIFLKHSPGNNVKTSYLATLKAEYEVLGFIGDTDYDQQAATDAGIDFFGVGTGMYTLQSGVVYPDVNAVVAKLLNC